MLLRVMLLRFPDRTFVFVGDAGYGTHELARFVHRHRARLTMVSKLHPEANLFEPPPPYKGKGRPPVKGPRRPKPRQAVASAALRAATVAFRNSAVTSDWRRRGAGAVGRCSEPPPACSACARSSPCCTRRCPKRSVRAASRGRARPA